MVWIILGSIFGGLLVLLLLGLYFIYRFTFYSPKKGQNDEFRAEPSLDYQGMREQSI